MTTTTTQATHRGREAADLLGPVGLWTMQLEYQPAAAGRVILAELEQAGYRTLWYPEALGRESLTNAAIMLGATSQMVIASGITSIWGRDPVTMAAAHSALTEAWPGRFLLGLGVSHSPLVEDVRGHRYESPLTKMAGYLDDMDSAPYQAAPPAGQPLRVLAALGPKMLELAAGRSAGALTYLVTPEHTAVARSVLQAGPLLAVEQAVVLEEDQAVARRIARKYLEFYLPLPNYVRTLRKLGFTDSDMGGGGSDRLVDALVIWGGGDRIAAAVRAHHDAGADHVCLQVLDHREDGEGLPRKAWSELAGPLLAG
jgi:probable F420-dependent oxidoreductase